MNKKIILKISILVSIFVLIFVYLNVLVYPKDNYKEYTFGERKAFSIRAEEENTIDVLILGDSEASSSINPMHLYGQFGITSYICSVPLQNIYTSLEYLDIAIDNQNLKTVLLETNTLYQQIGIYDYINTKVKSVFPIFKYHNRIYDLNKNDFLNDKDYTWRHYLKGYINTNYVKPATNLDYMKHTDEYESLNFINMKILESIVKKCDDNNIELILYSSPSTVNWNYKKHNAIEKISKEKELKFYDYNLMLDEIDLNWLADTRDAGDHINFQGSIKLTNHMGSILSNYALEDHRGEPKYEQWAKDYSRYCDAIESDVIYFVS